MKSPLAYPRRSGTVLIATLWIVFVLAGMAIVLARTMRVEAIASANEVAAIQAAAVERGAEQYVLALLETQKDYALMMAQDYFQAVSVGEGCFWIVRPDFGDPSLPLWGLVDEASKVNLNSAGIDMLALLPWMNEELAAAVIDWRDTDENMTAFGAENEQYLTQFKPYYCKNAPLETVEELLLIRGFTKNLLYGSSEGIDQTFDPAASFDAMQPGAQSPLTGISGGSSRSSAAARRQQNSSPITGITSNNDWSLTHGLYDYVTVYSKEPANATSSTGETKINVNTQEQQVASYLSETLGSARANSLRSRIRPQPQFRNIYDFYQRSGMTLDEFTRVAPRLTASANQARTGLINISTAPREVLLCLSALDENDVEAIIARRATLTEEEFANPAWVVEAIPRKSVEIGNLITTSAYQFSADIVAVSPDGRAFKRCRIVVDAQSSPARIVFRKDLTHQGWPLDRAILEDLRSGALVPSNRLSIGTGINVSNVSSGGTR